VTAQSGISERGKCYEIRVLREREKKWFIISAANVCKKIEISKFFCKNFIYDALLIQFIFLLGNI
jgi:hypothetical protein